MIKLPTFDNLFPLLQHPKTHGPMTTATTFSRQNDAGSCERTTQYEGAKAKAFLSDMRQPDVSHFSSPLIYLDADKFVLLSDFTLIEKI